jgi:hypothetical protein
MNAVAVWRDNRCHGAPAIGGSYARPGWSEPPQDDGDARVVDRCFCIVGLGVASFGGYFLSGAGHAEYGRFSHHLRRFHAQAPSGDVQPSAGFASHCERPEWLAAQLSVVFRTHRTIASRISSAAAIPRHVTLHIMRAHRTIHSWRRLTKLAEPRLRAAFREEHHRSRGSAPGAISLWSTGRSGCSLRRSAPTRSQWSRAVSAVRVLPSAPAGGRGIVA